MTRRSSAFSSLFLALVVLFLAGQPAFADRIDDLVRTRMRERNIPGAAIAVIRNGRAVKVKGYGFASVEFQAPVTPDTVFEIGSVSKQMTAAGIMLLVQDGKVSLDERISKYLPNTPDAWRDVTVRHLLTHTSGIKSYTSLTGFELSRRVKLDGFIKQLSPYPLEFTPGEKNIYSNSGYNLLAYIIETQSGKPYMDFMRERIFTPLGMTRTGDRDPRFIIPLRANGYEWQIDRLTGRDGSLTDLMGAGSITSTLTDLIKWNAALDSNKLLTAASKREMWTPFRFNASSLSPYGFGWRINDVRGVQVIGHTGQTAGFGTAIFRYPEHGIAVIALTNLGELGMGSVIASSVAKHFIPKLSLKNFTNFSMPQQPRDGDVMLAFRDRMAGRLNSELLSSELIARLSTDRARAADRRLISMGDIRRVRVAAVETVENKTVYRYLAATDRQLTLWRLTFGPDGKIAEMVLEEDEEMAK